MTRNQFASDDQYHILTAADVSTAGGNKDSALCRLLDDERDDSFVAVLDLDGYTVWTAQRSEDGEVVRDEQGDPCIEWESLSDFRSSAKTQI